MRNTSETLLVMFQARQGIPGINPQVFLPRHGNEITFDVHFFHFSNFVKNTKQICQVSLKYIEF